MVAAADAETVGNRGALPRFRLRQAYGATGSGAEARSAAKILA
jgi:hypothetical protein